MLRSVAMIREVLEKSCCNSIRGKAVVASLDGRNCMLKSDIDCRLVAPSFALKKLLGYKMATEEEKQN